MSHLNTIDIICAWKDPEYRLGLSEAERAMLPEHPAGLMELTDADLGAVIGGFGINIGWIFGADGTCGSHHKCCPKDPLPKEPFDPDKYPSPSPKPDGGTPPDGGRFW